MCWLQRGVDGRSRLAITCWSNVCFASIVVVFQPILHTPFTGKCRHQTRRVSIWNDISTRTWLLLWCSFDTSAVPDVRGYTGTEMVHSPQQGSHTGILVHIPVCVTGFSRLSNRKAAQRKHRRSPSQARAAMGDSSTRAARAGTTATNATPSATVTVFSPLELLTASCRGGNETQLLELLEGHGRAGLLNAIDASGYTPLIVACGRGHLELARLLVRRGALVDAADSQGCTALLIASQHGHVSVIVELMSRECYAKAIYACGVISLRIGAHHGSVNIGVLLHEQIIQPKRAPIIRSCASERPDRMSNMHMEQSQHADSRSGATETEKASVLQSLSQ